MNAGRADSGHNQVTAFDVRMRRIRAKRRATCIPTEVVKLITKLWHLNFADPLAVRARTGINIDNQQRVVEFAARWIKPRDERVFLWWRLHGQSR